jgi:hypothetical protein
MSTGEICIKSYTYENGTILPRLNLMIWQRFDGYWQHSRFAAHHPPIVITGPPRSGETR